MKDFSFKLAQMFTWTRWYTELFLPLCWIKVSFLRSKFTQYCVCTLNKIIFEELSSNLLKCTFSKKKKIWPNIIIILKLTMTFTHERIRMLLIFQILCKSRSQQQDEQGHCHHVFSSRTSRSHHKRCKLLNKIPSRLLYKIRVIN
jgi:hypothetical protein